ncbi:MAG: thioesterase domain-containing protein, partial [Pseudomonas sp.]
YVVLEQEAAQWRTALALHLGQSLPEYMVPSQWLALERMPLSPNGKLERKALPAFEAQAQEDYVEPQGDLEQTLAAIWAQVLGVTRVGRTDNFFELGGHSLLSLTLLDRIRRSLGVEVALSRFMSDPTLAGLARNLQGQDDASATLLVPLAGDARRNPQLFCFHPSYGSVYCYQPLAQALKDQWAVQGVVCEAFVLGKWQDTSWQLMIQRYTRELLAAQAQGPFYLLGWSLGGNIAMSVARQLELAGHQVAFLGMLDAPPPREVRPFWDLVDERKGKPPVAPDEHASRLALLSMLFPEQAQALQALAETLHGLTLEQAYRQVLDWASEQIPEHYGLIEGLILQNKDLDNALTLKPRLDALLESFQYEATQVSPSCWWAGSDKSNDLVELIEATLAQALGATRQGLSQVLPCDHDQIINSRQLLESLAMALALSRIPG